MDICGKCMGTGVAGHPDSGYTCDCNGGMTDPTPTRAEVEAECRWLLSRLGNRTTEAHLEECTVPMLLALRERAEAAERDRDEALNQLDSAKHSVDVLCRRITTTNAAWNDAIEAAEAAYAQGFAAIRALRRAAPTEGEV